MILVLVVRFERTLDRQTEEQLGLSTINKALKDAIVSSPFYRTRALLLLAFPGWNQTPEGTRYDALWSPLYDRVLGVVFTAEGSTLAAGRRKNNHAKEGLKYFEKIIVATGTGYI